MQNPAANPRVSNSFLKRFTGASDDPVIEARLDALLSGLYSLYYKEIDLGQTRTYRLLEALGNPHLKVPKVVHVAGTNGKGSTIATLRALLEASGHSVHVYTSPHLVHPTERIRLAGRPIRSEAFIDLLNECIEINQNQPITFFELTTCAAFLGFSRVVADFLILETGMGGRLDATNVIPLPAACIITTISKDHTEYLGSTHAKIAAEKGGIIKPGVPCVIGYQFPDVLNEGVGEVFKNISQDLSPEAPLFSYGAEWGTALESGRMLFRYGNDSIQTRTPNLLGEHQSWNAGAALTAFRIIAPDHFKPEILSTALGQIEWPGRLQTLENHPFNDVLPGWDIVIDGGHNDSAGLVLSKQMENWQSTDDRPLHLVMAMVNRKDPVAFLDPIKRYISSVTFTEIENEITSFSAQNMEKICVNLSIKEKYKFKSHHHALANLAQLYGSVPSRLLLTGSLFFTGSILRENSWIIKVLLALNSISIYYS